MEKIKVSKEIFDAFESVKEWSLHPRQTTESVLVERYLNKDFIGNRKVLNTLETDTFMRCVYHGYELEMSKEEKLKSRIKEFRNSNDRFCEAYVDGIYDLLDAYGIKIKGINE